MGYILVKALNKSSLCNDKNLYTGKGIDCFLKGIIAMSPVIKIKEQIAKKLGVKLNDFEITNVDFKGNNNMKTVTFKSDNDNLGKAFARIYKNVDTKAISASEDNIQKMSKTERRTEGTIAAESWLRANSTDKAMCFNITFKNTGD